MNLYQTKDLGLSAWLVANGMAVYKFEKDGKLTTFTFMLDEDGEKLAAQYYSSESRVSPMIYNSAIRTLKTLINRSDVAVLSKTENSYVEHYTKTR